MSVQQYKTDVLQEHVDSTTLLIDRLNKWKHAVELIHGYLLGYYNTQVGITSSLEKTRKHINDPPQFEGATLQGTTQEGVPAPSSVTSLADAFASMRFRTDGLIGQSSATANGIKNSIIPSLDTLYNDIETHFKTLKSHGQKGIKDVEQARAVTQKYIEKLGKLTSSFGTTRLDSKEDPYILRRHVQAAVTDQVNKENVQAEAALNVQRNFATLEYHIIEVIQGALRQLDLLVEGFWEHFGQTQKQIAAEFGGLDVKKEWDTFTHINHDNLVPEHNYQRDPRNVTYTNMDHTSTVPVIEGVLQRKGTVLKSWSTGFFVVTKSGFLHQFKSQDASQDTTPELSLYLPGSTLGPLPTRSSGELTFTVSSKNAAKKLGQKHKYVFKAATYEELAAWYDAIADIVNQREPENTVTAAPAGQRITVPESPTMEDISPSPLGSPRASSPVVRGPSPPPRS